VLDFDRFVGTPLRLTLGRLPAANGTQACQILAVTLIPTAWLELLSTALTQADPRPRSSAAAVWLMLTVAHGSVLLGRFSTMHVGGQGQVYFAEGTRQARKLLAKGAAKETMINQTAKETALEIQAGRKRRTIISWLSADDRNWLCFFDRSHSGPRELRFSRRSTRPARTTSHWAITRAVA
jgi:hypothetical protein